MATVKWGIQQIRDALTSHVVKEDDVCDISKPAMNIGTAAMPDRSPQPVTCTIAEHLASSDLGPRRFKPSLLLASPAPS